jgi:hypothetical protein
VSSSILLKDEVRDWYWWILDRFGFVYKILRKFGSEALFIKFNEISYRLFSALKCKHLATSSDTESAYFACMDIIVEHWAPLLPPPKREPIKEVNEIENRIKKELFSLRVFYHPFDITTAMGSQPNVKSALGVFKIQRIGLFYYDTFQTLNIDVTWEPTLGEAQTTSTVTIKFKSPTTYDISYSTSTGQREESEQQAIAILTEVYNNREQITNYINKSHDLLFQIFNGLTTYLLY